MARFICSPMGRLLGHRIDVCVFWACIATVIHQPTYAVDSPSPNPAPDRLAQVEYLHMSPPAHGETVDPRSGQLSAWCVDISVPAGVLDLEVRRFFEPRSSDGGLLGGGWRLNWERRLVSDGDLAGIREDGRTIVFRWDASMQIFRAANGDRLELNEAGALRSRPDGTTEVFDGEGALTEINLRNGNRVKLTYDTNGRLERIEGPFESSLRFVFGADDRLAEILASNGAVVRYNYAISSGQPPVDESETLLAEYVYRDAGLLSTIRYPNAATTSYEYDDQSRVTSRTSNLGTTERYEYDDSKDSVRHVNPAGGVTVWARRLDGRGWQITDPLGRLTSVAFDAWDRLSEIESPQRKARIEYDLLDRVVGIEDSRDGRWVFNYVGSTHQLASLVDAAGTRQELEYDLQDNFAALRREADELFRAEYQPDGLLSSFSQRGEVPWRIAYDSVGQVTLIGNAVGAETRFFYDEQGNLARLLDPLGRITTWQYDEQSQLVSTADPNGGVSRFEYGPGRQLSALIDSSGRVTRLERRVDGLITAISDPDGDEARFEYDSTGNLTRVVTALGGELTATYDAAGRVISETNSSGQTTRFEYSPAGDLVAVVEPDGNSSRYEYDAQGRVSKQISPAGKVTTYEYRSDGFISRLARDGEPPLSFEYDPGGNLIAAHEGGRLLLGADYDENGRVASRTYSTGRKVTYEYDTAGRLAASNDTSGDGVKVEFDLAGRPIVWSSTGGEMVRFGFDANDNLVSMTDALANVRRYAFDPTGRLTEAVGATGDRAEFIRDAAGNIAEVRRPSGGKDRFEYDGIGNVVRAIDPLGHDTRCEYDHAGRVVRETDAAGRTTEYSFDNADRVIEKRLADGRVVRYRYDQRGNLLEVDDGMFPIRWTYDQADQTIAIEYPKLNRKLHYRYDNSGRLEQFIDAEGRSIRYVYDGEDRLHTIQIGDGQPFEFSYDARDRRTALVYPNGVRGVWEYDGRDRVIELTYTGADGRLLAGWKYVYDAVGNCVSETDSAGIVTKYRYDAAGQIIEESNPNGNRVQYAYSPGGLRRSRIDGGDRVTYSHDADDRMDQAGSEKLVYDAVGNLVERIGPTGVTRYLYDVENRLVKIAFPDRREIEYGYAPTGDRVWRRDERGLRYFVNNGLDVVAELDDQMRPTSTWVHGPLIDQVLAASIDGKEIYFHADRLRSIACLSSKAGTAVQRYRYDAFGRASTDGQVPNRVAFTGRELEAGDSLYYFRARFYDASLGRFLSPDPKSAAAGEPLSLNPYQYAYNNPLRYVDRLGLSPGSLDMEWIDELVRHHGPEGAIQALDEQRQLTQRNLEFLDREYQRRLDGVPDPKKYGFGRGLIRPEAYRPNYDRALADLERGIQVIKSRANPETAARHTQRIPRPAMVEADTRQMAIQAGGRSINPPRTTLVPVVDDLEDDVLKLLDKKPAAQRLRTIRSLNEAFEAQAREMIKRGPVSPEDLALTDRHRSFLRGLALDQYRSVSDFAPQTPSRMQRIGSALEELGDSRAVKAIKSAPGALLRGVTWGLKGLAGLFLARDAITLATADDKNEAVKQVLIDRFNTYGDVVLYVSDSLDPPVEFKSHADRIRKQEEEEAFEREYADATALTRYIARKQRLEAERAQAEAGEDELTGDGGGAEGQSRPRPTGPQPYRAEEFARNLVDDFLGLDDERRRGRRIPPTPQAAALPVEEQVIVPQVVGYPLQAAVNELSGARLTSQFVKGKEAPEANRENQVYYQAPEAGALVPVGTRVRIIFYSKTKSKPVTVPSLIGLTKEEAEAKLAEVKLLPQPSPGKEKPPVTARPSQVFEQLPKAETEVNEGSAVSFQYYAGVPVGNYIGMHKDEAAEAITALGLVPEVKAGQKTAPSASERFNIGDQSPKEGEFLNLGEKVVVEMYVFQGGFLDGDGAIVHGELAEAEVIDYKAFPRAVLRLNVPQGISFVILRCETPEEARKFFDADRKMYDAATKAQAGTFRGKNGPWTLSFLIQDAKADRVTLLREIDDAGNKSQFYLDSGIYRDQFIIRFTAGGPSGMDRFRPGFKKATELIDERFPEDE